ncbi:Ubiquitin thioesterase OTU1 [Histomonas meleagridis]|uniref:Ubiquitin thioesterase OTU1 n=1 Tax=Histomonas meleagridis TaxID=135588 RepID=UPI00355A6FBD|nr:Ubiquitin thioesterase OTU1 [Histomonas meleagridis]KAH0799043.1 Ubiquitin thioesterase OTU1 [Histomonas meleagridis]
MKNNQNFFKLRNGRDVIDLASTPDNTVNELMQEIRVVTDVLPSRQQISYGVPPRLLPNDAGSLDTKLSDFGIRQRTIFILTPRQTRDAPIHETSCLSEAVKIPIPADNSCLFNSISYLCTGSSNRGPELRSEIVHEIRTHPDVYTPATLGCSAEEYCHTILDPKNWGGYIEMNILSKLFNVEICVMYIEECKIIPVNSCNATKRIFILYDNIHYDAVVFKGFGVNERRIVDANDMKAYSLASEMLQVLHTSGAFTNTKTAKLKCEQCGKVFNGSKEAERHGNETGHVRFTQC